MRVRSLLAAGLLVGSVATVTPGAQVREPDPSALGLAAATQQRWTVIVIGPAFPFDPARRSGWATRRGNVMRFRIPLDARAGRTVLYRNGRRLGVSAAAGRGTFRVPARSARYRLHVEASRGGRSTRVDWTFASSTASGTYPAQLPLLAIRFALRLDGRHRAPAGRPYAFAMFVQRNGAAVATRVHTPTVQVSYDDGHTWRSADVVLNGRQWQVRVTHPAHARFVALRAATRDNSGNAVRQTIIRAYALR